MEQLILTTFIIIILFSILNALANSILYYISKQKLYIYISIFWLTLILNFVLQSYAQSDENTIILLYGYAVIPLNILSAITFSFMNKKYPIKVFLGISAAMFILTFYLFTTPYSFVVKAMPLSIATASPLLYTAFTIFIYMYKNKDRLIGIQALILLLQGIHCFNFAIFRMEQGAQLWGWPVSYALYQLLAAILPAITLNFFHKKENKRLKELVQLRTQSLQKALDEKKHIFKILTHDVSNPLAIIRLRLDLYNAGQKSIEELTSSTDSMLNRITNLIDQARELEKVDSDFSLLKLEEIDVLQSVQDVANILEEQAKLKDISITIDFPERESFSILADRTSFENSILVNFISNAIKFSHQHSEVNISLDKSADSLFIRIADSGIGIPESIADRIYSFSPLSSRSGTNDEPGNGFGISIAKKYIDYLLGEITLDTQPQTTTNPGHTIFTIKLPLAGV